MRERRERKRRESGESKSSSITIYSNIVDVIVLDISNNPLLSSWKEIANIAGQLTYLKELCVRYNSLCLLYSQPLLYHP